jgi:hypothetical protein
MLETPTYREEIAPSNTFLASAKEPGPGGTQISSDIVVSSPSYDLLYELRTQDEPGSRHTWKSFQHYKRRTAPVASGNSATIYIPPLYQNVYSAKCAMGAPYSLYNSGSFGAPGLLNDGLPVLYIPSAGPGFVPAPNDLTSLVAASLRTMLPQIKAELSSVNSTIELKDFASLKGTIRNIDKLQAGLLRKKRAFKNIAHILRVAADVYLQAKFNILPLISDVKGVYRSLSNIERQINGLVSRAGKNQIRHFRVPLTDLRGSQESETGRPVGSFRRVGGFADIQSYTVAENERTVQVDSSEFHAQIQYNYHYAAYQLEHARVLALMDAWGLNLNPQIIWNAIPWSFVVDWLVGVGQWLATTRIGNMDPKINIMQYLWSVRRSRRITVTSRFTSDIYYPGSGFTQPSPIEGTTHPVVFESAYRRQVGLPSVSLLTTSGLNSQEFTLGAALAITRRRHRPGRGVR